MNAPRHYPQPHKLALAGSIIAALAVIPAWWHIPFSLALAADLTTAIHAPDRLLILAFTTILAVYHAIIIITGRRTHALGEIPALLIAAATAYLLYIDIAHLLDAYTALGGPASLIRPPNAIYAIVGIIGALAAAGASTAILIDIASDHA